MFLKNKHSSSLISCEALLVIDRNILKNSKEKFSEDTLSAKDTLGKLCFIEKSTETCFIIMQHHLFNIFFDSIQCSW